MGILYSQAMQEAFRQFSSALSGLQIKEMSFKVKKPNLKWHQTFILYNNNSDSYSLSKASFCFTIYEQSKEFLIYRVCSFKDKK